jgi:hypothetical protein
MAESIGLKPKYNPLFVMKLKGIGQFTWSDALLADHVRSGPILGHRRQQNLL